MLIHKVNGETSRVYWISGVYNFVIFLGDFVKFSPQNFLVYSVMINGILKAQLGEQQDFDILHAYTHSG